MTNIFDTAKHIIAGPPMPTAPRSHRADVGPFTGVDPLSRASAWYAMTGPLHCACKRCAVGWPHRSSVMSQRLGGDA